MKASFGRECQVAVYRGTATTSYTRRVAGSIDVAFDSMDLLADPGLTLTAYSAEPDSPSEDALKLLASRAATTEPSEQTPTDERAH